VRQVTVAAGGTASGQDFTYRVNRQTRRIRTSTIAALIETAFAGTQLHLNNYGSRHGDSWHKANDSFLRLGPALGGRELRFNIPEVVIRAKVTLPLLPDPKYTARYYVNDFNLSGITARAQDGTFKISLNFESRGTELKGRCSAGCIVGSDGTAPDFQINNAHLVVSLTPARHVTGGLSYGSVSAAFHARVDASGIGEFFDGTVKREIKSRLEPAIVQALSTDDVRTRVAAALRATLDRFGIGSITSVRVEGDDLVIEHIPRVS
jgi:hypothetical protein